MKINIGEKNKGGKLMNDYNNFSESYSNPRVKKLRSFAQSTYGMEAASYKGIAMKTLYFVAVFAAEVFFFLARRFSPSVLSRFSASAVVSPFLVVWFSVSFFSSISSTMYLPFRFFGFCLCLYHMRTSPKKELCTVA